MVGLNVHRFDQSVFKCIDMYDLTVDQQVTGVNLPQASRLLRMTIL